MSHTHAGDAAEHPDAEETLRALVGQGRVLEGALRDYAKHAGEAHVADLADELDDILRRLAGLTVRR